MNPNESPRNRNELIRASIPRNERDLIYLHPERFDPDKLAVNEIVQPNGLILAKIPQIPHRITRRKKNDSGEYYIELIISRRYDPKTKQNRNKKVIIGTDFSYHLRGMMIANDQYHDYFNNLGDVLPHIRAQWEEEERRRREAEAVQVKPPETQSGQPDAVPAARPQIPEPIQPRQNIRCEGAENILPPEESDEEGEATELQLKELREREAALDAREKELESREMIALVTMEDSVAQHVDLLRSILLRHEDIVEEQAKRRPDKPMSLRQIQTINEVLQELRALFTGSEIEDFLHLAEEPAGDPKEPHPGTTYAEMALLLNAYDSMLHSFACGKLMTKGDTTGRNDP